jgi:hypothetical protein
MGENEEDVSRAVSSADFLEWNFSLMRRDSPWDVEQGMTQLLAHENAEGFGPRLSDAVQHDARVIDELGRRPTPTAVAALRGFQAMSPVDTQRELARLHADRLVQQGQPEPPWVTDIGRVRVDGCWWAHDHFGETAVVLAAFSYDGEDEHGVLAIIDRAIGGGRFRELTLGLRVASLLNILNSVDGGEDGLVSEPLDPATARRLLEDAIATSDEVAERPEYKLTPLPATYRKMRALTLARARRLSDVAAPVEAFPGSVEIELLKQTFLASDAAAGVAGHEATGRAVDLLVGQFVEQAACHPLQLGPRRVLAVLGLPALAAAAATDPAVSRILPEVATAWIGWTAVERRLPADATARLLEATGEACDRFRSALTAGSDQD